MTRSLTNDEKETLARFDKWLGKAFFKTARALFPAVGQPVFSTSYHVDKWGNILIDNGKMQLIPPINNQARWGIRSINSEGKRSASAITLEATLLAALSIALHRNFINHY